MIASSAVQELLHPVLDQCRAILLNRGGGVAAWQKRSSEDAAEWVTELDGEIEERLTFAVRAAFPQAGIVGEEHSPHPAALDNEYCFVIDPIDGTRELLAGNDGYSISIALLYRRRPILGLLDFPARGRRFVSVRGAKTVCNAGPITVSRPGSDPPRFAVSPAQVRSPRWPALRAALEGIECVPTGALGSKLAAVASGEFDAAFFMDWEGSRAPVWDFAAAGLVVAGAGGMFTTLDGASLCEELPDIQRGGWLASNANCHEEILDRLRSHRLVP
jgi:myo-inositol-1(or 4)-monophosphatase